MNKNFKTIVDKTEPMKKQMKSKIADIFFYKENIGLLDRSQMKNCAMKRGTRNVTWFAFCSILALIK